MLQMPFDPWHRNCCLNSGLVVKRVMPEAECSSEMPTVKGQDSGANSPARSLAEMSHPPRVEQILVVENIASDQVGP
jgi:hypothetical protein